LDRGLARHDDFRHGRLPKSELPLSAPPEPPLAAPRSSLAPPPTAPLSLLPSPNFVRPSYSGLHCLDRQSTSKTWRYTRLRPTLPGSPTTTVACTNGSSFGGARSTISGQARTMRPMRIFPAFRCDNPSP
jgi:hypothetical protein